MAAEGGDGNTFATWLESPAMTEPHRALSLARMARPCALLALAPLLAGCVAAVAVPAMTAAGVLSRYASGSACAASSSTATPLTRTGAATRARL